MNGENMARVVAGQAEGSKTGTIVCDLDGVLYIDKAGVPGAASALAALQQSGFHVLFVTNNSTKTPETVVEHIAERTGFEADLDAVVTSAMATAEYLADRAERCLVLGGAGLIHTLNRYGIEVTDDWDRADAVATGLDLDLSYERVTAAMSAHPQRRGVRRYEYRRHLSHTCGPSAGRRVDRRRGRNCCRS